MIIPTRIIVDQDRHVVAVEIGAKKSAEDFTNLFDSLLNTSEDSAGDVVDQPVETASPEENTWFCSICHALNSNDDAFCTNCAQSRRCPKCGSSMPLDDRYCSICSEEVEG